MRAHPSFLAVCFLSLLSIAAGPKTDSIQQSLDLAKNEYSAAAEKASKQLVSAFDQQIASVSQAGDLDAAEELRDKRKAFIISEDIPTEPTMRTAVTDYKEAMVSADATLSEAYDTAISSYTTALRYDDAERIKRMKAERFPPAPPNADQGGAATKPADPILEAVQQSKQEFLKSVEDANADLVAVIDSRAKAAGDDGDLNGYKYFSDLSEKVKHDLVVPDDVVDTRIRNANAKFLHIAKDAFAKLHLSYQRAISDYTKERHIDEAEAMQAELDAIDRQPTYLGRDDDPLGNQAAKIRFAEDMGYTIGSLNRGARTHNNDVVTYADVPSALSGMDYTLVVAKANGHVRVHFLTSGKMYVLASSWMEDNERVQLSSLAQKEGGMSPLTSSGAESWTVWSITAKAGADVDLPFPVPIVAASLEKANP
jgi:hypothetical protein